MYDSILTQRCLVYVYCIGVLQEKEKFTMAKPKIKTEMISFRAEAEFKTTVVEYAEKHDLTFTEAMIELVNNGLQK